MNLDALTNLAAAWPLDWLIIGAAAALLAFDALRSGGNREAALVLALPAALLALELLPSAAFVGGLASQFSTPLLETLLLGMLFVPIFALTLRILGYFSPSYMGPVQALAIGVGAAAALMIVWTSLPALDALWHFGPSVHAVFGEPYRLWWLLLSLVGLAYARS